MLRSAHKRKAGGAPPSADPKKPKPAPAAAAAAARGLAGPAPKAARPAKPAPAKAGDAGAPDEGSQEDTLVLNASLRHKHLWRDARPPANPPQLIGDKHAVAVMLGDTLRAAAAAGGGGEVRLRLGGGRGLRFAVDRRSVVFSRQQVAALAADEAACKRWNSFVSAALAAWQADGKEASQAARLGLLKPLMCAR